MWCSLSAVDSGTVSPAEAAASAAGTASGCTGAAGAAAAFAGAEAALSSAGMPSCSSGSSGRLMVSSFSGLRAAGFSSSAVPNIWKIDFFSGFGGSASGSAGALANTTGGSSSAAFCAAFSGALTGSAADCAAGVRSFGCGTSGTGFAGWKAGVALPLMPLSISFSCCISRCSSSSCGSSVSGAFFALGCFWGTAAGCGSGRGAGFSGCTAGAGCGAGTGFSGTASTGSARAGADCNGLSGIAGTGSSVRSSSAISSCSGCTGFASAPSKISPVGISSTGCAGATVSALSWPNSLPSSPALGFSSTGAGSSRRIISSGRSITLVLKKLRNRSSAESPSACLPLRSFLLFGILVPPTVLDGVYRCFYSSAARCDWISYRIMPAATETL